MESNQTLSPAPNCPSFNPKLMFSVTVLYLAMFPIALVLNGVAAWVSIHLRSTSSFMVYLKNIVAADLFMTLTLPIKAASDLPGASMRLYVLVCRYFTVIFYSCMYTSITLLGLVSVDRFFKIVRPKMMFGQKLLFSKMMSAFVWVMLFGGTAIPTIVLTNQSPVNMTGVTCMSLKGRDGLNFHGRMVIYLNAFFWFVSVVTVVSYICIAKKVIQSFKNSGSTNNQGKQKTKLRVFLVLAVFFVCYGPYHLVRIPYTFQQVKPVGTCLHFKFIKEISLWLATTNICLDPLLYVFLCREFREKLMSMIKCVASPS
ncbi:P2Y purinoceptor 13-like [Myripristis murdjan]|uniref:P2Y purinoceptor 13-like n=1 Tax=Myripristis murdjan TaxID=586833 RepID=UPI001175F50F|nr:P2Y purinoceptor 13-like [Myripristis murdjan]